VPLFDEANVTLVPMGEREVFEWGFQKKTHQTATLVTSFVTSAVQEEGMEESQKEEGKEETVEKVSIILEWCTRGIY